MTVFIVRYDSGMYGAGVSGVFSTEAKADAFVEAATKNGSYTSYEVDEVVVDDREV